MCGDRLGPMRTCTLVVWRWLCHGCGGPGCCVHREDNRACHRKAARHHAQCIVKRMMGCFTYQRRSARGVAWVQPQATPAKCIGERRQRAWTIRVREGAAL